MIYELTDHFRVAATLEQTWAFFSSAENLPKITPPHLGFTILTPAPIVIQNDVLLDYTIRWFGIPVKWKTRIIDWSPPRMFIDLQLRGPYTLWHHQHTFAPLDDGSAAECRDRVIYMLPFGVLGRMTHSLIVRKQLLEIFRFRRKAIGELLGELTPIQDDVRIAPFDAEAHLV